MAQGDIRGSALTGSANSITNPMNATGSVDVSVGDLVFVTLSQQTNLTATGATDNLGHTYSAVNAGTDAGTVSIRCFYVRITTAGTLTTVSVATSASTNDASVAAIVIEGPFVASPLDANPANTTDGTTPFTCPATGTLAQANEVVMAAIAVAGNQTVSATEPSEIAGTVARANASVGQSKRLVSSTSTVTPEFTGTSATAAQTTASFKLDAVTISLVTQDMAVVTATDQSSLSQNHISTPNDVIVATSLDNDTINQVTAKRLYIANTTVDTEMAPFDVSASNLGGWNGNIGTGSPGNTIHRKATAERRVDNVQVSGGTGSSSGTNRVVGVFSTGPLLAQHIFGSVRGQVRANQSFASDDRNIQIRIRVVSGNGSVERGILLDFDNSDLSHEFATSLTNRFMPKAGTAALTPVTAQAGDRILVEVGVRRFSTAGSTHQFDFRDDSSTDLPVDETTAAANNSWIEFTDGLQLQTVIEPQGADVVVVLNASSITQAHFLPPDGLAVVVILDTADITQIHFLPTDALTVVVALDSSDIALAAATDDLSSDDLVLLVAIDEAALTQNHVFPSDGMVHVVTLDSGTVAQNHLLPSSDLDQLTLLDASVLIQNHLLPSGDLIQVVVLDSSAIAAMHLLSSDGLDQLLLLDTGTLTQNQLLSSGDLSQLVLLDANALTQNHLLPSDDLHQVVTLDSSIIVSVHLLSSNDLLQLQLLDTAALLQDHLLSSADLFQPVILDSITLAQLHFLISDGMTQVVVLDSGILPQNQVISSDDLTVAVVLDTTNQVQVFILTTDSLAAITTLDNAALHQEIAFTINDLVHLVTVGDSVIAQVHMLPADNSAVIVVVDDSTLIQLHRLVNPGDLSHLVTLEMASFVFGPVFVADGLVSATVLNEVQAGEFYLLEANDLLTLLTIGEFGLYQQHYLLSIDMINNVALDAMVINDNPPDLRPPWRRGGVRLVLSFDD